ncbi:hypothetical protein AKH21_00035 [Pelagibacteraceae bacterium GOM-A5]|nr:hypothetical protein AKH21_00035 [Pelagibacteraceae bacterium GOM-A5]
MISYLVIGICLFLLLLVIYVSAKPISMGIEARRNLKDENSQNEDVETFNENSKDLSLSDELMQLNKLKEDGVLTEEEYKKAKEKLLS